MSYDKNGLGFMEISLLEMYWPETLDVVLSAPEGEALSLARKYIDAYNQGVVALS